MAGNSRSRSDRARRRAAVASFARSLGILVAALGLQGCELPVRSWVADTLLVKPGASPAPLPSGETLGVSAQQARANAELLQEILTVVTLRPPVDPGAFGTLVDSLNQGASLEGIYNGIVHSSDYRALEEGYFGSSNEALRAFATELAAIELEFKTPKAFDAAAPRPLPVHDPFDVTPVGVIGPPMSLEGVSGLKALSEAYRGYFAGSSVFVLKRVLGDEAQRLVAGKQALGRQALTDWYAAFAARAASLGVDFGLARRNGADARAHRDWARAASPDRLLWEVLNRLHRIVNAGEAKRKAPASPR
jgi:hypothetical protein